MPTARQFASTHETVVSENIPQAVNVGGSAGIAARLRRSILEGVYGFSERLPAERHLADTFGVSRGTVREALRRLEELSMVTRQIGSGTFVTYREFAEQTAIADVTSPLELIDVRFGIEPQMVRLAIANATAIDLERLHKALIRVESTPNDPEKFTLSDSEFHLSLAECTRNRLMVWLYQLINETRTHTQWATMKDTILTPERIAKYNAQHRQLYNAIASRNLDTAVNTIHQHLEKARVDLMGASSA
jgi:DNA-binding FadR family transcriptional regulator